MPQRRKGPRLWLEPAERDASGRLARAASWVIRDGPGKVRTGCGPDALGEAEKRLAAYIVEKHAPARASGREPDHVMIADVISVYSEDVASKHARPGETANRLARVLEFFGTKRLSAVNGALCRAYANKVGAPAAARRDLEDFRAAIKHYHQEGYVSAAVPVTLPERGESREGWLTRNEAAQLLWAAWRMRQRWRGKNTHRWTGRHLARFILVALYTGTRAGAVCGAAIRPTVGRGYVDLERGVFYRKPPGAKQTKKRQPPIPLPDRLLAHLRRWERLGLSQASVVEWNGGPVLRISKSFRSARAAAGFGPDIVPHTLRHTSATWLMQAGCDLWTAAGYLGMTVETLQRIYGHHHPAHLEGAREAMSGQVRDRKTGTKGENDGSIRAEKRAIAAPN